MADDSSDDDAIYTAELRDQWQKQMEDQRKAEHFKAQLAAQGITVGSAADDEETSGGKKKVVYGKGKKRNKRGEHPGTRWRSRTSTCVSSATPENDGKRRKGVVKQATKERIQ